MKETMGWLLEEESGQGMVEYGLILAVIAVAVIVVLKLIGGKVTNKLNELNNNI